MATPSHQSATETVLNHVHIYSQTSGPYVLLGFFMFARAVLFVLVIYVRWDLPP